MRTREVPIRLRSSTPPIAMLVVHHLNNSRSQRVLWLLEELELEYEVKCYQRDAVTMLAPTSLRRVHPLGKSPVITDGSCTLAESGAIIEYVIDAHGRGRLTPVPGTPEHFRYRYWLHYAEGSAMPLLLMNLVFNRILSAPMPFFAKPIARAIVARTRASFIDPSLDLHLNYMEAELDRKEWFAGSEFSAADIQMSFPLEAAAAAGRVANRMPNLCGFLGRIRSRPAYQRALARGGKYDLPG